ncbi:lysylphosphatidylglycerol synthase domain-containing protein [Microvirga alba]|uniref:Flippase-like domain-containing protein n=1 Tax=Microvirga alba TaxID=2791025 RepID=A0A931BYT9_9HYPH|nr:lysylphosphatidylglycerol synthase domain-containing protein [Microvirga alba]MBF9235307.1 flippase-like domain-containing protein [Microvirga alba]
MRKSRLSILFPLLGAIAFLCLIAWAGLGQIWRALDQVGWPGFALICLLQTLAMGLCATAWWLLTVRMSYGACFAARIVRDGTTSLASIVPGLGEAVGTRILILFGMNGFAAGASILLDIAAETLALALYISIGLVLLSYYVGWGEMVRWAGMAAVGIVPILILYWAVRHRSARRLVYWVGDRFAILLGLGGVAVPAGLAAALRELHGRRWAMCASVAVHLMAWVASAFQIWVIAHELDRPLGLGAALLIDSLVHAARGAFYLVPWGTGIQEGAFILVGAAVGLDAPSALAMSLIFRVRDLVLGGPAALLWGLLEWRRARLHVPATEAGEPGLANQGGERSRR